MIQKNKSYEAVIEDLTLEGSGLCRVDGFAVFVPMTAVGDRVRFKAVKVQKNVGYGILEQVITPSPARQPVDCPVFRQCGGGNADGFVQSVRNGFFRRSYGVPDDVLHGDRVLYHERLLYGRRRAEKPLDITGGPSGFPGRHLCQCGAGRDARVKASVRLGFTVQGAGMRIYCAFRKNMIQV